jgi:flagella basal body P-ring formation protein FlgA
MSRGSLLSPASVQATQVPAREADSLLITDAQHLEQMEAVRDLPAGVPLRQTDIRPAVLVRQGQWVTMTVGQGTGFTITVRLEALQDGRLGERVILRNAESGRTISGVVTGMNAAKGA